jgi:hypothetical protein
LRFRPGISQAFMFEVFSSMSALPYRKLNPAVIPE